MNDEIIIKKLHNHCKNDVSLFTPASFKNKFKIFFPDQKHIRQNFESIEYDTFLEIISRYFVFSMISWQNISFDSILDIDYELSLIHDFIYFQYGYGTLAGCYFNNCFYISNDVYKAYRHKRNRLLWKEYRNIMMEDNYTWKDFGDVHVKKYF